jgi:hypothetical protein
VEGVGIGETVTTVVASATNGTGSGLTPTRYVEVRQRFLREHPGHTLDGWPLPAD